MSESAGKQGGSGRTTGNNGERVVGGVDEYIDKTRRPFLYISFPNDLIFIGPYDMWHHM